MKKNLLLFLVSVCLCTVAHAQPGKMMYGVKGGLNMPNIRGMAVESSALTTFHAGLFYNRVFAPQSRGRVQLELLYSSQGADLRDDKQQIRLNYIALPIALQLGLGDSYRPYDFGVYLEGGLQIGYLQSAKMKDTEKKESVSLKDYYANRYPDRKLTDIDASAFAGIGLNMGYSYQINCRYLYGLNSPIDGAGTDGSSRNSVFQISMAIAF